MPQPLQRRDQTLLRRVEIGPERKHRQQVARGERREARGQALRRVLERIARNAPVARKLAGGSGALGDPPFAVLVSGDKDMMALATLELPTAAEFEAPVAPGVRPGELGVYSQGGRLVTLVNIEALVSSQLDLSRAS